jgi:hypothetical protein
MKVITAVPTTPPRKFLVIIKSRFITKVFTLFLVIRIEGKIIKYLSNWEEYLNARGELQIDFVV